MSHQPYPSDLPTPLLQIRPQRAIPCRTMWFIPTPCASLIIEDDRDAADYIVRAFRETGHVADHAADGEEGLAMALDGDYDVLIVDRMLPKRDGLSVIGELRAKKVETPVLILSALGQVDDRVKGLRAGGDDYLPKPYSFSELLARVEVLARRRGGRNEETVYRVGDLELDRLSHRVTRGTEEVVLQPREFRLLEYLMKHAGQVVTRTMLLENVWDYHFDPQTNVIDVHISRLRSKIDKGFAQPLLHTIRGAGYMIRDGRGLTVKGAPCCPGAAERRAADDDALGKLFRTTAFKLTLVYLTVFALFAAFLLGYFALNTRRLFTEQVTQAVDMRNHGPVDQYNAGGIRRLTLVVEARSRRPGSSLYLVTTAERRRPCRQCRLAADRRPGQTGLDGNDLSADRGGRDAGAASRAGARRSIAGRFQASGRARSRRARPALSTSCSMPANGRPRPSSCSD